MGVITDDGDGEVDAGADDALGGGDGVEAGLEFAQERDEFGGSEAGGVEFKEGVEDIAAA